MAEINDFSVIDDSNTARWPEGMALASVNNAARATEGILGRWYQDFLGVGTVTGSGGAYVLTLNRGLTALFAGLDVFMRPNHDNPAGGATLNLNALGAVSIKVNVDQDPGAGDLKTGLFLHLRYDGTNFQVISAVGPVSLNAANVFTQDQTIDKTGSLAIFTVQSDLNTGVPGIIRINGHDSGGVDQVYAEIQGGIVDNTAGAETGAIFLRTPVAGTFSNKAVVRQGLYAATAIGADPGEDNANFKGYFGSGAFLLPDYIGGLALTNNATDSAHDIDISAGSAADSTNAEMLPLSAAQTIQIDNAADRVDGSTLDADTVYYILVGRDGTSAVAGFSKVTTKPAAWDTFRVRGAVVTDASSNIINNRFMTVRSDGSEFFQSELQTVTRGAGSVIDTGLTREIVDVTYILECVTADAGFNPGDRVHILDTAGAGGLGFQLVQEPSSQNLRVIIANNGIFIGRKSDGVILILTDANWRGLIRAETL